MTLKGDIWLHQYLYDWFIMPSSETVVQDPHQALINTSRSPNVDGGHPEHLLEELVYINSTP